MHGLHTPASAAIAMALVVGMTACAAATGTPESKDVTSVSSVGDPAVSSTGTPDTRTDIGELPGEGPYQRFIVKYRQDSVAAQSPEAARAHLQTVDVSGLDGIAGSESLQLDWQRRLAVGADVFTTSRPLDRQQAAALMDQFGSEPQVEYIEIDGVATIQQPSQQQSDPESAVPPPKPLGND